MALAGVNGGAGGLAVSESSSALLSAGLKGVLAFAIADNANNFAKQNDSSANCGESGDNSICEKDKIKEGSLADLPDDAIEMYQKYDKHGWKGNVKGQAKGTRAHGKYHNNDPKYPELPKLEPDGTEINYFEFDIHDKIEGVGRSSSRFVHGSDGSVYYTDIHYEGFIKIK